VQSVCIEAAHTASPKLVAEIASLVRQLSSSAAVPDLKDLSEIIESPTTTLLVARDGADRMVGILTLVAFRIPTGLRAFIEEWSSTFRRAAQALGRPLPKRPLLSLSPGVLGRSI
jgi:hypothetical protein